MRVLAYSVLTVLLLAILPAAQAAEEGDYTLWLHKGASLFMSDDPADPANDNSRQYCNFTCWGGASHATTWTSAPMATALSFRPGDTVHVEVRIGDYGGWVATWGTLDVRITIKADAETIASGAVQTVTYAPGTSYWRTLVWDVEPTVAGIAAGQTVTMTITTTGQASGYVIGSRDADGRSLIRFPAVVAASPSQPVPVYEELASPSFVHDFANATSGIHVLNFTTDLVNSTALLAWNATSGHVNATLRDANGTAVFNGTLQGNGTLAHAIANATAGAWNLTLSYTNFNGTFSFELTPPDVPGSGDPADPGSVPTDGNGTATLDSSKDTPVPLLVPVLGVLVAVAARRRS